MKVVIDNAIPYIVGIMEPFATVEYLNGSEFTPASVKDADMLIIRTRTRCNAALLEGSRVKLIATATIGFDHIDLAYCAAHGIEVTTAEGCNAAGVLQWVAAALAMLAQRQDMIPERTTLGIVGVGHVGSLIERYARSWGFGILRCDPPRKKNEGGEFIALEQLLSKADIITLHTPLDATTHHLINRQSISLIRPDAVIINASRGEVADTDALLAAPQQLFIDVWEHEPAIDRQLLQKAVVTTPHIAGYSAQGKANASAAVIAAAARRFSLPLEGWYPPQVQRTERRDITWQDMCATISKYCDLNAQSLQLQNNPESFEALRNAYNYRQEYF